MKIAILGTRGIPNQYGGFEQCAQYLSKGLKEKGHSVYVYNSHDHPFKKNNWNGVNIIHKFDPEKKIGTAGQFIYDLNCILDCRQRDFDVILQLGYTSSSIWSFVMPPKSAIITNMDGLEWKRSKYKSFVKLFLKYAERLAVKNSKVLVADSEGIRDYLQKKYNKESIFIPYGAEKFSSPDESVLEKFGLTKYKYDILIARLEPENSIETILQGATTSTSNLPIVVIGNYTTKFGQYIKSKFEYDVRIHFFGPIYNISVLNNLRYYSNIYFHGHTVGGTNPSLLEAMASKALICAHKNQFNLSILGEDSFYFENSDMVREHRDSILRGEFGESKVDRNYKKIINIYQWERIVDQYETVFNNSLN